ncbi:MAG: hypothetical protein WCK15_15150, partial [Pirellula sp.]
RPDSPLPDQHPTGINPARVASALRSQAGYDYRPTGASPVETNTASTGNDFKSTRAERQSSFGSR